MISCSTENGGRDRTPDETVVMTIDSVAIFYEIGSCFILI